MNIPTIIALAGLAIFYRTNIDEKLLQEARAVSRAATDTETVRMGLEALIRHAAYERLRALRGTDPAARDVPRRRERPPRKRSGA